MSSDAEYVNMRYFFLIVALSLWLAACSREDSPASSEPNEVCVEPSNPFNDGGGHDAGFNWAEDNDAECPADHGDSFHEGCEEYHVQRERFDACEARKRK